MSNPIHFLLFIAVMGGLEVDDCNSSGKLSDGLLLEGFQGHSGAPLRSFFLGIRRRSSVWASNKILILWNLSVMLGLGFRRDSSFRKASGDLSSQN